MKKAAKVATSHNAPTHSAPRKKRYDGRHLNDRTERSDP